MSHAIYGCFRSFHVRFPQQSQVLYVIILDIDIVIDIVFISLILFCSLVCLFTRVQLFLFMIHISTKLRQYFSSHFHGSYRFCIGIGNGKHKMFHTHKLLDGSTRLYLFMAICILDFFFLLRYC